MIDLYTWTTPNGRKVSILLEELGVPYTVQPIDITADEQFSPAFLGISPNNRIPAIVDHETGVSLMESGAIMLYLAEKHGRFMPAGEAERWQAIEWLMWQMGGLGPMAGQAHHFLKFNPRKAPYAEERYAKETARLYGVLDRRLANRDFVVGNQGGDYSIADMAIWPWISRHEWHEIDLHRYEHVLRWYRTVAARPAVQAGYHVPGFTQEIPLP